MSAHPLILTLDQHDSPHHRVGWQHACACGARELAARNADDTYRIFAGEVNRVTSLNQACARRSQP